MTVRFRHSEPHKASDFQRRGHCLSGGPPASPSSLYPRYHALGLTWCISVEATRLSPGFTRKFDYLGSTLCVRDSVVSLADMLMYVLYVAITYVYYVQG